MDTSSAQPIQPAVATAPTTMVGGNAVFVVTHPTSEIAYGMYMRTREVMRHLEVFSQQCKVLIPPEVLAHEMDWEPTVNSC